MHFRLEDFDFSFDLPDGWTRKDGSMSSNFYGPKGRENSEMISILIGVIDPICISPEKREQMLLAELGGSGVKTHRDRVGDEDNVLVLSKPTLRRISVVRDGIHYMISHSLDGPTEAAIERLKQSAQFQPRKRAQAVAGAYPDPKWWRFW